MRRTLGIFLFWLKAFMRSWSVGGLVFGTCGGLAATILGLVFKWQSGLIEPWILDLLGRFHVELVVVASVVCGLVYGPYALYRDAEEFALKERKTAQAKIDELKKEIVARDSQRANQSEQVLLNCIDVLERGYTALDALRRVKADELQEEEQLVYVCNTLNEHGHHSPFHEGGILDFVPKGKWLTTLRLLRLRTIRSGDQDAYEFVRDLVLTELEAKAQRDSPANSE